MKLKKKSTYLASTYQEVIFLKKLNKKKTWGLMYNTSNT